MQVLQRTVTVLQADSKGQMQQAVIETVPQRVFTYQEMKLLAALCNFSLHAAHGDMHADILVTDSDAPRMVLVLKRCE